MANCATCNKFKPANQREPLIPHEIPDRPWAKLGGDLFEFGNKVYLIIVDYFSKFPEVSLLPNKGSKSVITAFIPTAATAFDE